jgi:Uma2 family endonuclease
MAKGRMELMTVEDLYTMPDDGRKYELQGGILVSEPLPGFRHGRIAIGMAVLLSEHVEKTQLGVVIGNDSGFILSEDPDTVRGPDVAFVSRERVNAIGDPVKAFPGAPDLAVEVLSPSNTRASMHAKVADYLAAGSRRVWVVDPEARTVKVYASLLSPRELGPEDVLSGEDVIPGFEVVVGELFGA